MICSIPAGLSVALCVFLQCIVFIVYPAPNCEECRADNNLKALNKGLKASEIVDFN